MAPFFAHWRFGLILPLILALTACTSVSLEDTVPGARNTGAYPNLNIPPVAATEQLTDEEASSRLAALRSTRSQIGAAPGEKASEAARLRRLGQSHADDAIEEIEN